MLNRRNLRVKVMQSLYALQQAEKAAYHGALDHVAQHYAPDYAAPEPPDLPQLEADKQHALAVARPLIATEAPTFGEGVSPQERDLVMEAWRLHDRRLRQDRTHVRQRMLHNPDNIFVNYLRVLALLLDLAAQVDREEARKKHKYLKEDPATSAELRFARNPIIEALRDSAELQRAFETHHVSWEGHLPFVRQLYREVLRKDDDYLLYLATPAPDLAAHDQAVRHVLREVIFRSDLATRHFEENDLYFVEDRDVIRSMALRTIKSVMPAGTDPEKPDDDEALRPPVLAVLSPDWEEDRAFFLDLFEHTVAHRAELEPLIAAKAQNWDAERMAALDKVMLLMALTEMIYFPSIPVKVTINEYIEISKRYSTPKSKQFINGLLDVLADELQTQGRIRKSGRGLLDNR